MRACGAVAKTRDPRTLLELCIARAGAVRGRPGGFLDVRRGGVAATRVVLWALASKPLGRVAPTASYAEFWRLSERQAWRHRADLHELFPGDEFELVIAAVMRTVPNLEQDDGELYAVANLGSIPAPELAVA
jgi:hypothetical protein